MDEKTLRVFAKIVDKGSLTAAADALGYTQPAITHMLNNFEQNLGFKVLIRDKKGARLTPDGERIMPAVYDHLYAIDNFKEQVNAVRQRSEQRVSLHTVRNLSIDWLEDVIMRFGIDYPEIKFDLREGNVISPSDMFSDGETNFAIIVNDGSFEMTDEIRHRKLYDDELMVLMPFNHELADLKEFPVEEFSDRWFVTQSGFTGYFFNKYLIERGIRPIEKAHSTNDINLISRVYSGFGLSLRSGKTIESTKHSHIRTVPLEEPVRFSVEIACTDESTASPSAKLFREYVEEHSK